MINIPFTNLTQTHHIGRHLIFLPECSSTNDILADLAKSQNLPQGNLLITSYQTSGRGQRNHTWQSQPCQNLTFSFIWYHQNLPISSKAFDFNMATAIGLQKAVASFLPAQTVSIKWSNDIMVNHRKIAGILIENTIKNTQMAYSIIGIGLNVNQTTFTTAQATSMTLEYGTTFNLACVLERVAVCLEEAYQVISFDTLRHLYTQNLYRYHEKHLYENISCPTLPQGRFEGVILGINPEGKLGVAHGHQIHYFDVQEIRFLYENMNYTLSKMVLF